MRTTEQFPEFDMSTRHDDNKTIIEIKTYVRVERDGEYWKVLITSVSEFLIEKNALERSYCRLLQDFMIECKKAELFWQKPKGDLLAAMLLNHSLVKCDSHLTNKENDILRYARYTRM